MYFYSNPALCRFSFFPAAAAEVFLNKNRVFQGTEDHIRIRSKGATTVDTERGS